jgi:glucosamine--fructose-6-phosphate aminotransferase (isomerizing)
MCRVAIGRGAVLTSISNVAGSTQERLAAHRLQQRSGPEMSVLSTKSLVSQVVILARLALEAGRANGALSPEREAAHAAALSRLPDALRQCIHDRADTLKDLAIKYANVEHWFFIGRGLLYPAALEAALKFKEASYRQAEGLGAGFFKHGTISLISPGFHTIALLPQSSSHLYAATHATVSEISARGGTVSGFGPAGVDSQDLANFTDYVDLPYVGDDIADLALQLVAGQLFAYFFALNLGREIDQPRYLAKSVTVR